MLELFLWPVSLAGENPCLARRRPGFEAQTDHNLKIMKLSKLKYKQ